MTNWQLDAVKQAEDEKAWEMLNAPDPCEKQLKTASVSLLEAVHLLSSVETRIADAMCEVFDTPMEYKIGSYLDSLEDIECDLKSLAEKYGRGERE